MTPYVLLFMCMYVYVSDISFSHEKTRIHTESSKFLTIYCAQIMEHFPLIDCRLRRNEFHYSIFSFGEMANTSPPGDVSKKSS